MEAKEIIARRVAQEFYSGAVVNLGIGLPTLVPRYLPPEIEVVFQSENGFVGLAALSGEPENGVVNAGGQPCGLVPGAAIFDSALSFALIRGGHIDITVLGGLQVDSEGSIANWMVPGKMVPGMGGAMDLLAGTRKVIIAMEHCTKEGEAKIVERCTLPLTARRRVSMLVTELAVFSFDDKGLVLEELSEGVTLEAVRMKTQASYRTSPKCAAMRRY